ncbi:MAG: 3-deoxy-D-manno-octulosonic acid transferase [Armatimonadota bacterium]
MNVVSGCSCQKSMWFVYNEAMWLLSPAFLAYGLRRIWNGTRGSAVQEWTGRYPNEWVNHEGKPRIWVHAVSVGEVVAASSVIAALKQKFPNSWLLVTTVTETGMRTAKQRIRNADAFAFLPFDITPFPKWAMKRVKPDVLVLTETELWGNLMHEAKEVGAKIVLVNGRISDATFSRSQTPLGKLLYQWLLSHLDICLMRSELDAERILKMGVQSQQVKVTGDVKLDQPQIRLSESVKASLRSELGLFSDHLLFIAGSTHEGEEEAILRVYQRLCKSIPNLRLLLAPRHLERVESVMATVRSLGLTPMRRSMCTGKPLRQNEVLVLDTIGELAKLYALATVAFVGGSLIQRGGHNVMEPILHGVPVLFGPYVDNFRPHAELLLREKVGFQVRDENELTEIAQRLLTSEPLRRTIAWQAEQLLAQHRGAAERVADAIARLLDR